MAAAYLLEGRAIGSEPAFYYATGSLEIGYRRPTPMQTVLELEAEICERIDTKYVVDCRLSAAGKLCARGRVEAVPVPTSWMGLADARK